MREITPLLFWVFLLPIITSAQQNVSGVVKCGLPKKEGKNIYLHIEGTMINTLADADGVFTLQSVPNGNYSVIVNTEGYEIYTSPIKMNGTSIDLGTITLIPKKNQAQDLSIILISDDELDNETSSADNISGLLQASKDVYLRTAAFEWGSSFYSIRGLGSENGKVLINGIEMNKIFSGRPLWSNWGGLNDVLRNQEFSNGLSPSNYAFGGVLGSTHISTRASEQRAGGRFSYASSNRSYTSRMMGSYASGILTDGWAFTFSGSRRMAREGFIDGTSYNAYSMFGSLEKKINDKHSVNFTSIFAFNKRGKSAPNTQEVYNIKGIKYNPHWGNQNGSIRNSRYKRTEEPIVMLNHYWDVSDKTLINTNISYQFGEIGNSRLDYNGSYLLADGTTVGGGENPDASYYKKLPSYALKTEANNTYALYKNFEKDGQIPWNELYEKNSLGTKSRNSTYVLYEDRNDDKQFTVNTILRTELNENIMLNSKLKYTRFTSNNFAEVLDLLGGDGYLDVNTYGDNFETRQNDLLNPNKIVKKGDAFKYHYQLNSEIMGAFLQGQFQYKKVEGYVAFDITETQHQREGFYKNGSFKTTSFGESKKLAFTTFSGKVGGTYKITGRHLLNANAGYITNAPTLRKTFSNARANNNYVLDASNEKTNTIDASYIFRSPIIRSRITGYYTAIKDATNISFYFAEGFLGEQAEFVQEVLTGINKNHFGVELGFEVQVTPTLKIKGASNIGQYTYANNPNIYLTSDDPNFSFSSKKAFLKGYKIASGPQKAYTIGFEYSDPDYWWFGVTGNFLSDVYINIAALKRTSNFALDTDELPFSEYNSKLAKKLLAQEKFDNYFTLNAVGGKSWRVAENKYIGFFASIGNITNTIYKTGGFEQARTANYRKLKEDSSLETPLFGNKYWYGRGTTYFVNINYRF